MSTFEKIPKTSSDYFCLVFHENSYFWSYVWSLVLTERSFLHDVLFPLLFFDPPKQSKLNKDPIGGISLGVVGKLEKSCRGIAEIRLLNEPLFKA